MKKILNSFFKGEKKDFLLSFCIPTYNRPEELRRLLITLLPQLTDDVELFIKDDSIDNKSENIVKEIFLNSNVNFKYFHGEKEGIDEANIFIAEHASGKFVWWFGDDDELLPGALEKVLSAIKQNPDLCFIWINLFVNKIGGLSAKKIGEDKILKGGNEFLEEVGIDMTLLSTGVFNRALASSALPLARKYSGTHFASQPLIFEAVSKGKESFLISQPYIINHPTELKKGENLFWDGVKTMGVAYFDILMEFKKKFSMRAIRKVLSRNFGHIWRGLIIGWIRRDTEAPRKRIIELARYWTYPEFYVAVILFLLPKKIVEFLLGLYKIFFKKSYLQQKYE